MPGKVENKIKELGLELPEIPEPVAEYVPAKRTRNLIFCSGQGPTKDGKAVYTGKVGAERTVEDGYEAARICALNCLAVVKSLTGTLDKVKQVVKVRGFVNSTPEFGKQPEVVNGASELLVKIFNERGKHARSALGTSCLPRNITVELEMVVEVED